MIGLLYSPSYSSAFVPFLSLRRRCLRALFLAVLHAACSLFCFFRLTLAAGPALRLTSRPRQSRFPAWPPPLSRAASVRLCSRALLTSDICLAPSCSRRVGCWKALDRRRSDSVSRGGVALHNSALTLTLYTHAEIGPCAKAQYEAHTHTWGQTRARIKCGQQTAATRSPAPSFLAGSTAQSRSAIIVDNTDTLSLVGRLLRSSRSLWHRPALDIVTETCLLGCKMAVRDVRLAPRPWLWRWTASRRGPHSRPPHTHWPAPP